MSTKTDIANVAIASHSGEWISDFDAAPGRTADAIRAMWASTLDLALAAAPWKFAKWTWRDQAAVTAEQNPDPDQAFAFRLPADCVRAFEIRPRDEFYEWGSDDGSFIACAHKVVTIIGTRRTADVGRFSAYFADYVGKLLALRICTSINASEAIRKRCEDDAAKALTEAKSDNGRAGTLRRVNSDSFMESRFQGAGGIPR